MKKNLTLNLKLDSTALKVCEADLERVSNFFLQFFLIFFSKCIHSSFLIVNLLILK